MHSISFNILIISFHVLVILHSTKGYENCTIEWSKSLPNWFPILYNNSGIIYPRRSTEVDNKWSIVLKWNSEFSLGCGDPSNHVQGYDKDEITVICKKSGLMVNKAEVDFGKLGCEDQVREKVVVTGECLNGSTAVDIMFQSNSTKLPLLNICHNKSIDETLYSHHFIVGAGLNPYEVSNSRPSFKEAQFYTTISANDAYKQSSQLQVVAQLVGSQDLAERYINPKKSFYLARGHLAPDGDFVHIYEQNATYYFINVVPQWQSINNGNWKALESALRNYAKKENIDLEVWTGGHGIMKLDDANGNPVDIYLAKDSQGVSRIPAPELTWKFVHDSSRNASVAIVTVNNPHYEEIPKRLLLCPNVCSNISWVTWDINNIPKGYTYCCDACEFKKSFPFLSVIIGQQLMT